jgi:hypothetical protein
MYIGLFLFMGMSSFADNQFVERIILYFTDPELRECNHNFFKELKFGFITKFTMIQFIICAIIFIVTLTPAAVIFPVLIGVLIPFRLWLVYYFLDDKDVNVIDPYDYNELNCNIENDSSKNNGNIELNVVSEVQHEII